MLRNEGDVRLVAVLVLRPPGPLTLRQPAPDGSRILVSLRLSSSTTMGVVAGVHGETPDAGSLTEPSRSTCFAELARVVLFADGRFSLCRSHNWKSPTHLLTVPTVATQPGSIRLTSPLCNLTKTDPRAFDLVPSGLTSPPIFRISAPPKALPFGPWWAMI